VLPVFNEADVLPSLHAQVSAALQAERCSYEILFVNDGSTDASGQLLDQLADANEHVRVAHLSRNFGHQAALQAGLELAQGDVVAVMDSDLQDNPAELGRFFAKWREGFDVIYAVRKKRKEGPVKRFLFFAFHRLLKSLADTAIPADAGNFCLLDAAVARRIVEMPESDRYFPGLRSWTGFRQIGLPVERGSRYDASPRVSCYGLFQLAKTALFSFSRAPLSMFYGIAGLSLLVCLIAGCFTLYHKCVTGLAVPGWTSITMVTSLFGALNALGIAVLGEYVVRIYDQVRSRPHYVVDRVHQQPSQPIAGEQLEERLLSEAQMLSQEARQAVQQNTKKWNERRQIVSRREAQFE